MWSRVSKLDEKNEKAMKKKINKTTTATNVWVVYFVGFEDQADTENTIEPRIGYEQLETTADADQQRRDAEMAAFLRGGQVLAVVDEEDENVVQSVAAALEKQILRMR